MSFRQNYAKGSEQSRLVIGIDPGLSGAIAAIKVGGGVEVVETTVMPLVSGEIDIRAVTRLVSTGLLSRLVVIESVHSMPKQGVSSTFKFGKAFGILLGVCGALRIPYILITPQQWKKTVLYGLDWKQNKGASVTFVQRRFPDLSLLATPRCKKPHDGIADAVCLAMFGVNQFLKERIDNGKA